MQACRGDAGRAGTRTLTVFAAASLARVFPRIGDLFQRERSGVRVVFHFAGTDQLAAQIEQGAPADVFAGASATYGDLLVGKGLIRGVRPFCTNRLVVVLPPANPAGIHSLLDLARPGVKVVLAGPSVPIGSYTRAVLDHLEGTFGGGYGRSVLSNAVSEEQDVEGVLSKVRLGEADAGFVYVTDARAAGPAVRPLELPRSVQAVATYPIGVVVAGDQETLARAFEAAVLGSEGQEVLRDAGFGPPPP